MPIAATLVTLAEAKDQIRTTHTFSDAELQRTLDDAEDMIRRYLKARNEESWTPETVPGAVRAAILRQFTHLFAARGDRADSDTGAAGLAPHVEHTLSFYRDPAWPEMSRYRSFPALRGRPRGGAKDRPVAIEQRTHGTDESGFPVDTWSELAALEWMHREDLGGAERFIGGAESSPIDSAWIMGFRADMNPEAVEVTAERRLRYEGRVYDIVAAQLLGLRDGIQLLTTGAVSNAPSAAAEAGR